MLLLITYSKRLTSRGGVTAAWIAAQRHHRVLEMRSADMAYLKVAVERADFDAALRLARFPAAAKLCGDEIGVLLLNAVNQAPSKDRAGCIGVLCKLPAARETTRFAVGFMTGTGQRSGCKHSVQYLEEFRSVAAQR
jgi:hypothetical protein